MDRMRLMAVRIVEALKTDNCKWLTGDNREKFRWRYGKDITSKIMGCLGELLSCLGLINVAWYRWHEWKSGDKHTLGRTYWEKT